MVNFSGTSPDFRQTRVEPIQKIGMEESQPTLIGVQDFIGLKNVRIQRTNKLRRTRIPMTRRFFSRLPVPVLDLNPNVTGNALLTPHALPRLLALIGIRASLRSFRTFFKSSSKLWLEHHSLSSEEAKKSKFSSHVVFQLCLVISIVF